MSDTQSQLRLRILTGVHAGAEVPLTQGQHVIGSDPGCDVVISDWLFQRSLLFVGPVSTVDTVTELMLSFEDEALGGPLGINQSRRIGEIAIVVFSDVSLEARLTDLELLSQMLAPAPQQEVTKQRGGVTKWVAGGIVFGVLALSVFTFNGSHSVAATKVRVPQGNVVKQVNALVTRLKYPEIHVFVEGKTVVVTGLVKNQSERQMLATQLAALHLPGVLHKYAVESEIASAISDAIAMPGITARHVGGGKFEIVGDIPGGARNKIDLERLKNDFGHVVSAITFSSATGQSEKELPFQNIQTSGSYQIRLATDGVKYFMQQ